MTTTTLTTTARDAVRHTAAVLNEDGQIIYRLPSNTPATDDDIAFLIARGYLLDLRPGSTGTVIFGRYVLTEAGVIMRKKLEHRDRVEGLARTIRRQHIDGEELAAIAASIDAGEREYVGNERVHVAMALVASLAPSAPGRPLGCSAEDIRQEVEAVLGWND